MIVNIKSCYLDPRRANPLVGGRGGKLEGGNEGGNGGSLGIGDMLAFAKAIMVDFEGLNVMQVGLLYDRKQRSIRRSELILEELRQRGEAQ